MGLIVEKAYRYRIYPTIDQMPYFLKTFGCCRFIFNYFLALRTATWKEQEKGLNYNACAALLKDLKSEYPWLREISSVCLQQSLRHLESAFSRFFKKDAKYPRFKKRYYNQSASFMKNSFAYENGEIQLAKLKGFLNIRWSRRFEGEPTSLTLTMESSGRFYISILVKEKITPLPFKKGEVGLDLGLTNTVTDNQGKVVCNPRIFQKREKIIRKRQKNLSRKIKGSKNAAKARKVLAIAHAKIRDQRNDFHHKLSTRLVNENQVIAVETLQVKNMMKNKHLSKSIGDVGWTTFIRFLEYKCHWYGKDFVKVDRFFPSSKLCSDCGHKLDKLELSTREWECPKCCQVHNRDTNAAKNILTDGLRLLGRIAKVPWGSRDFKPVEFV